MSRKDYQLIAEALQRSAPDGPDEGFALAVGAVAQALAIDNPRFDRERFYAAVYPHLVRD